jgi:Arc/MetJ-type ribon-helix-helix transcriptional regulator
MMYTAPYMAATRTQVYLSPEQRCAIDELRASDGRTLAEVIRAALDEYLAAHRKPTLAEMQRRLDEALGSMPGLEVPSREEWDRFGRDLAGRGRDPGGG